MTIRANGITRIEFELNPPAQAAVGTDGARVAGHLPNGAVKPVPYTIGVNFFKGGDAINVTEVKASSPDLKAGAKVVVKGYYILVSEPEASLCLFATATKGSGKSRIQPFQTTGVKKRARII